MLHLLLVDDHQMLIEGIKTLLRGEPDLQVVAEANSGIAALEILGQQPIDMALLDINMPQMSGIELCAEIRRRYPHVRMLALSMFEDYSSIQAMLHAGASGYILKNTSKAELLEAVRRIAAGHTYFTPLVASTILDNAGAPPLAAPAQEAAVSLSPRELEILQLIAQEFSNQEIADKLFISERTVETHRKNLFFKTQSKSVVGLIQYAIRHELIK
jgi:DNA-binding NarL/FixJ family response regulator